MTAKEDLISFAIPVLRVTQPIGSFFIGVVDRKRLCEITDFDVRRLIKERDFEKYLGIQRPLDKYRVKEIREYVTTSDACFRQVSFCLSGQSVRDTMTKPESSTFRTISTQKILSGTSFTARSQR